ncbi:MAG: serine protease [Crocosphaera sp.]|nr:serine protease [Crocosphaera sp.]
MRLQEQLLGEHQEVTLEIIRFFLSPITDQKLHQKIKQICLDPEKPNHDFFLNSGGLTKRDFICYWGQIKNLGTPSHIPDLVIDLLVENNLIRRFPIGSFLGANFEERYGFDATININFVHQLYINNLVFNYILGFDYIIQKYRKSVFKIEVINSEGYLSLGTGFLCHKQDIIITNKHIVENHSINQIYDEENNIIDFDADRIKLSKKDDIALIWLKNKLSIEGIMPSFDLKILNQVITMGYPRIPTSKESCLVVHLGEINSTIENFQGNKLFLISTRTSPGSSGSPILDKSGRFVGIVSENLFEEHSFKEKGITPYHAGIPASLISQFLSSRD